MSNRQSRTRRVRESRRGNERRSKTFAERLRQYCGSVRTGIRVKPSLAQLIECWRRTHDGLSADELLASDRRIGFRNYGTATVRRGPKGTRMLLLPNSLARDFSLRGDDTATIVQSGVRLIMTFYRKTRGGWRILLPRNVKTATAPMVRSHEAPR